MGRTAGGLAGALELDRPVDPVRVGAGQRPKAPLGCCLSEYFGTGDADAEGEVGVDVKVSEHLRACTAQRLFLTAHVLFKKFIEDPIEFVRLIQLDPVACPSHHPMGKPLS